METTLTLDDDVAEQLERLRRERGVSLAEIINEALRSGLTQITAPDTAPKRFSTPTADLGECLIGDIVNINEALTAAEGEWRR